jgi:hypothetical protein
VSHDEHLRSDAGQLVAGAAIDSAVRSDPADHVAFGGTRLVAPALVTAARLAIGLDE